MLPKLHFAWIWILLISRICLVAHAQELPEGTRLASLTRVPMPIAGAAASSALPMRASAPATLYLMESISLTSEEGVLGLAAGTRLQVIRKIPGGVRVRLETGEELSVMSRQVTANSALAEDLAQAEEHKQKKLAAHSRALVIAEEERETARHAQQQAALSAFLRVDRSIVSTRDLMPDSGSATPPKRPTLADLKGTALDYKGDGRATVHHPKKRE